MVSGGCLSTEERFDLLLERRTELSCDPNRKPVELWEMGGQPKSTSSYLHLQGGHLITGRMSII